MEGLIHGHRACAGCGCAICMNMILRTIGKDVIIVNATGCMEIISTLYPETSWDVPYIHSLFENAPAVASGIARYLQSEGKETKVICIGGDGGTYDIGFAALSGMLERNENVLYICYDNEAYMNTGVQRSSATPLHAETTTSQYGNKVHGKLEWKKPILDIVAAHKVPYVASASIAFPEDLTNKIKKALNIKGSRFIDVHCSCPLGWGHDSSLTIEKCRQAVECGMWVLFEVENGKITLNKKDKTLPVKDYIAGQKRFSKLSEQDIKELQSMVDKQWEEIIRRSQ